MFRNMTLDALCLAWARAVREGNRMLVAALDLEIATRAV